MRCLWVLADSALNVLVFFAGVVMTGLTVICGLGVVVGAVVLFFAPDLASLGYWLLSLAGLVVFGTLTDLLAKFAVSGKV